MDTQMNNEVKTWIEKEFKEYIELNSQESLEKVEEVNDKLLLNFGNVCIELSHEEIEEIHIIITEYKTRTQNNHEINGIYEDEENKYIVPVVSNKNRIDIEDKKKSINFLVDKDKYFNLYIENTITLRVIYILIKSKCNINFRLYDTNGEQIKDLSQCFEISYISYNFQNCINSLDKTELSQIVLSSLYYLNTILNQLVVPKKLCKNSSLCYFKLDNITGRDSDMINVPFNMYDLEPMIYYLVGETHDDFRFKYLDIYHVLEFYFDRAALSNIREMLKLELSNPILYFDDNLSNELSKKIKDIVVGDKNNNIYKEKGSLLLVLKLINFKNIIKEIGKNNNGKKEIILPEIKINGKTELEKIKISLDESSNDIYINDSASNEEKILGKLKDRIYIIRNSIAHSKEEFSWRLKPNSDEITKLEECDLELLVLISKKVLEYFKRINK